MFRVRMTIFIRKEVYTEGEQVLNVTDGIGQILLPFRFGAWPEADVIVLKKYINENHDTEDTL